MNYTSGAWEEEQMSNLGCESVSDLIEEVKRLRKVNDELQGDLEQFIEKAAEDEAGLKDELAKLERDVEKYRSNLRGKISQAEEPLKKKIQNQKLNC